MSKDALIIVDVQNDFCLGGSLPVPNGDKVVEPLNRMIGKAAKKDGGLIIASRDWHPRETNHFAEFGGRWPVHCVQGTKGAEFHPGLLLPADKAIIVSKGMAKDEDAYSAFQGSAVLTTADDITTVTMYLRDILGGCGVDTLYIGGLATDYCVKATALDARRFGYEVYLLIDACRGVAAETTSDALIEMARAGVKFIL
ncbi:MAG: nicotinamidase [Candidatus Sungiibacteriota bacterium]|uniref:nicotinamidase n=1 Tax=Candidatus Sungiibacteriota bacterium TaxID=2750080 RepID=A0A7T5RK69_9BACT|nr:MAG: nicotinamidase [Candidatus Sungbacteria bacterium]